MNYNFKNDVCFFYFLDSLDGVGTVDQVMFQNQKDITADVSTLDEIDNFVVDLDMIPQEEPLSPFQLSGHESDKTDEEDVSYELINRDHLATLDVMFKNVTVVNRTVGDGRLFFVTQEDADFYNNDLPLKYFDVIKSRAEKIYEKYLIDYLSESKKVSVKFLIKKEIFGLQI